MAGVLDAADLGRVRVRDNVIASSLGVPIFTPPAWAEVPALLAAAMVYVNTHLAENPLHAAAYAQGESTGFIRSPQMETDASHAPRPT